MRQRAGREGITEKLKADNQMEWVGRINTLRPEVTETANNEVIFVCGKKYHLCLTAEERRYIFNALPAHRNKLLAQNEYTDLVTRL